MLGPWVSIQSLLKSDASSYRLDVTLKQVFEAWRHKILAERPLTDEYSVFVLNELFLVSSHYLRGTQELRALQKTFPDDPGIALEWTPTF